MYIRMYYVLHIQRKLHALLRSWLPESGGEVKVFEGGSRSITLMYLKGNVCESDNMQFCDKVYLDLKPECPRIE